MLNNKRIGLASSQIIKVMVLTEQQQLDDVLIGVEVFFQLSANLLRSGLCFLGTPRATNGLAEVVYGSSGRGSLIFWAAVLTRKGQPSPTSDIVGFTVMTAHVGQG